MAGDPEKRQQRYKLLRDLGYSPKAAARLRDLRSSRIEASIKQQRTELQSIPRAERSKTDTERLRSFRNVKAENNRVILTKNERKARWSEWSSKSGENFPREAKDRIVELNTSAGNDEFDSFGYQAYWFEWVEEFDDVDDGDFYEDGARR